MKIVTYSTASIAPSAGVLLPDDLTVLDANRLLDPTAGSPGGLTMRELLSRAGALATLRQRSAVTESDEVKDAIVGTLPEVSLHAPITDPSKIIAAGMNYADHIAETGLTKPEGMPGIFSKLPSSIIGPSDSIRNPRHLGANLDYEGELAIVIGVEGIVVGDTGVTVAGWTVANDVSLRDLQIQKNQLTLGKGIDTFCPLGPAIYVPSDGEGLPQGLTIETFVNDELRQSSTTASMVYDVATIVQIVADAVHLEPGDLLLTGSPSGVGMGMTPQSWLTEGDVVRVRIEGIGEIQNTVVAWNELSAAGAR